MFDIGFSEMMVIALVALVVIGPERLPKVARTIGTLLGRMQRYVNEVKAEVEREMRVEELKKLQSSVEENARVIERSVHTEVNEVEHSIREIAEDAPPVSESLAKTAAEQVPSTGQTDHGQLELSLDDGTVSRKQA